LVIRCLLVALLLLPAVALAQDLPDDPCLAGQELFVQNNYLGAEPLLKECLAKEETIAALLPLTMITVIHQRDVEGVDFGKRALALAPDNPNVRYWYGRALLIAGDPGGALLQWEQGLALDVHHIGILEGLARMAMDQGDDAKAYNLLNQMSMEGVDEGWLHQMLSDLARRKGLWAQAATHWKEMIRCEGEDEHNLLVLGELYILAGNPEEAVDLFRHAIKVIPSGATYGGLGEAFFSMDQVDSAAVALTKAVELDPENARNRFNLANALVILDQPEEAGRNFQIYVEQVPADPLGHFNYGVHLERQGQMDEAVAQLEEAVALDPEYVQAYVILAQMYETMGRNDDALRILGSLERLDLDARAELSQWRARLEGRGNEAAEALAAGKVHLMHIVSADPQAVSLIIEGLAAGQDFAALATRFSTGPTAVRGGDIGWVRAADMTDVLRDAIESLEPNETSPPVEAGGLTHFFKRVQ